MNSATTIVTQTGGKTEREARETIAKRGYWVGRGKRAFDVAKGMQARTAIPGARYSFDVFNANGSAFKSQWNSPRFLAAYEVLIDLRSPKA